MNVIGTKFEIRKIHKRGRQTNLDSRIITLSQPQESGLCMCLLSSLSFINNRRGVISI